MSAYTYQDARTGRVIVVGTRDTLELLARSRANLIADALAREQGGGDLREFLAAALEVETDALASLVDGAEETEGAGTVYRVTGPARDPRPRPTLRSGA